MTYLKYGLHLFVWTLSLVYLLVINAVQVLCIPVYLISKSLFQKINLACANSVLGVWVILTEKFNQCHIEFTGDRVPKNESAFLFCNHRSAADMLVLMSFFWRKGTLSSAKWMAKNIVKYFPGFGWGLHFLDCIFLTRNWNKDKKNITNTFKKIKNYEFPFVLTSFLEGTRFSQAKLLKSQEYARSKGLYIPKHTLVPRVKGFLATVNELRDTVDAVYDYTIGYKEENPSVLTFMMGVPKELHMHVRRYSIHQLPNDDAELTQWLFDRYQEKDELLEHFYAHGYFPGENQSEELSYDDWVNPLRSSGLKPVSQG